MGYDYTLNTKAKNKCEHCGRSDSAMQLEDSGMTWNHNFAFFELFPNDGFRGTVLHKPLIDVIPKLELILEYLENNGNEGDWVTDYKLNCYTPNKPEYISVKNLIGESHDAKSDGWCSTVGNAYYFINELLEMCYKHVDEHPDAQWEGQ